MLVKKCACLLAEESQQRWELVVWGPTKKQTFNSFSLRWYEDKKRYRTILENVSLLPKIFVEVKLWTIFYYVGILVPENCLCSAIANYVLQAGISVAYLKKVLMDLIREAKYNFDSQVVQ